MRRILAITVFALACTNNDHGQPTPAPSPTPTAPTPVIEAHMSKEEWSAKSRATIEGFVASIAANKGDCAAMGIAMQTVVDSAAALNAEAERIGADPTTRTWMGTQLQKHRDETMAVFMATLPHARACGEHPAVASAAKAFGVSLEAPLEVTAVELWKAYEANAVTADGRFKGKRLSISGKVKSVQTDHDGNIVIDLQAGEYLREVRATLASRDPASVEGVRKGSAVVLECVGAGLHIVDPAATDCRLK